MFFVIDFETGRNPFDGQPRGIGVVHRRPWKWRIDGDSFVTRQAEVFDIEILRRNVKGRCTHGNGGTNWCFKAKATFGIGLHEIFGLAFFDGQEFIVVDSKNAVCVRFIGHFLHDNLRFLWNFLGFWLLFRRFAGTGRCQGDAEYEQ